MNNLKSYNKKHFCFYIMLSIFLSSNAQEKLTGTFGNQTVQALPRTMEKQTVKTPLDLPFLEDFSTYTGFPDLLRWSDSTAYINQHMSLYSISIGMATLDGADSNGELYPLGFGEIHRPGDSLTSQYINLETILPSDSVYLSFFYQCGGLGLKPGNGDSLIVDFHNGTGWENVWAVNGNISDVEWRQVLLPIKEDKFLHGQFRFRFRNIISPSGGGVIPTNCDFWNLDYIRMNKNRHHNDTVVKDVAFTRPPNSVLRQYAAMPWRHFKLVETSERGNIDFYFANHDNVSNQNITSYYKISRPGSSYADSTLIGANNYAAFENTEYSEPVTRNLFPFVGTDSVDYLVETKIIASSIYPKTNNVASRLHRFSNYYAYDDGTAENGYDLNQAGNMVAIKYETKQKDSLRGVYMYFNTTRDTAFNTNYFDLCVWANDGGIPGQLIYVKSGFTPSFNNENRFQKLMFDSAIVVNDHFFVGWRKTTERIMSVGIDLNTPTSQKNFYNRGQQWEASSFNYAIMIRPIIAHQQISGMENPVTDTEKPLIFPVPASHAVTLTYPDLRRPWLVTITDLSGRTVFQATRPQEINVLSFGNGIYIASFIEGREKHYQKIVIQR